MREIAEYFSAGIKMAVKAAENDISEAAEIRIRCGKPLIARVSGRDFFISKHGVSEINEAYIPTEADINETFSKMCGYSPYAFEDEIKNGYITLNSGHRVGICGQAVTEDGRIKTIKNIASLNIRVSREIVGVSEPVIKKISNPYPVNTLIVSPPGLGKTTLLRDIVRNFSDSGFNVAVADERSELCAFRTGLKNSGTRTDVLDGCPKSSGMLLLLRAMSPQVIAVDEIGGEEDMKAILYIMSCGVSVLATVHGGKLDDIKKKPGLEQLTGHFERFILLGQRVGKVIGVYDECFNEV